MMRHLARPLIALTALTALVALTTGGVAAGNFAEVTYHGGTDEAPPAGEAREIRFSLLQHGVTPVDHGTVELTAVLPGSGERVTVEATPLGGGAWVATITFPVEGDWQLRVTHSVFETSEPVAVAVTAPSLGWLPGALVVAGFGALALVLVGLAPRLARRTQPAASEPGGRVLPAG